MAIKTIYLFDEDGNKVPVGTYSDTFAGQIVLEAEAMTAFGVYITSNGSTKQFSSSSSSNGTIEFSNAPASGGTN